MTRLSNYKSVKVSKHEVLYRDAEGNYRKTYNTRIYIAGNRRFVLWDGFVCWLRKAYRGHYVVWTMQSPSALLG